MILITGGDGQLGTELQHLLDERGVSYKAADIAELDITDKSSVDIFFEKNRPSLVYNCAAYTAVDKEEDEGKELGERINVYGTKNIAEACANIGATMVQISTDYVFGGYLPLGQEWEEGAEKHPVSEYGRTKDLGEQAIIRSGAKFYVIRTAWLFGSYGPNFVFTMQSLAKNKSEIIVVNDQYGRPTWSRTLAEFMIYLTNKNAKQGFYHLTNDTAAGENVTWYDFAKEILKDTDVQVLPTSSKSLIQKAKRPFNSALSLKKAKSIGFEIPLWQDALSQMLKVGDLRTDVTREKGQQGNKF